MKPNALNRLEKLELLRGQKGSRIQCIVRLGVVPGRGPYDPRFYRDQDRTLWTRERGETTEAFRERATAEAITRAQPRVARIIGYESLGDEERSLLFRA